MSQTSNFERLPKDVIPINYDIELEPDLKEFTFKGHAIIDVQIHSETNKICLNSAELAFDKATIKLPDATFESTQVLLDADKEVATITFEKALKTGKAQLIIDFTGILNDRLKGFYRCKYTHPSGEVRYAASTQFEAPDARRAFPCWDEPAAKATFDITLIAEKDKTVLSNMPLSDTLPVEHDDSLRKFKFQRTPIMSTYLVAFIVGEFDFVEERDSNGVLIRVYTPLGKKELGKLALDVAVKCMPFYAKYFGIPYDLPKLDMIAVSELSFGAMENWGLVTYRESRLLYDPANSSIQSKQIIATIVGHELAHQWFGNLVTMEWWTHLWLNEGFASWIEYLCVDHCLPELDIWTNFVTSDYCRALELDSLKTSHPIEVQVGPPSEVDEIFDAISYSKGASTIRMLHSYIGDEVFRAGLHDYLDKFKYKNAVTEDLWEALSNASKKPVEEIMELWTKQVGYPCITVSSNINDKNETVLTLTQQRFFSNGSKPTQEESFLWKVPITVITAKSYPNIHKEILLEKSTDTVNLGVLADSDWIKLNKSSIGLYRTHYSTDLLDRLKVLVKAKTLHPTDRLGLQSDAFALAKAGLVSVPDLLEFVSCYTNEDNYAVWKDLIENLTSLSHALLNTSYSAEFKSFVRKLLKPASKKLGWNSLDNENDLQSMCRATVLRCLGINGDEDVQKEARKRFENHLAGVVIDANLRSAVYASVLVDADEETLNKFIELHNKTDLSEEKLRIATALGSIKNELLIKRVLEFSLSPSVRSQDSVSVICAVSSNTSTKLSSELAWRFIKENWDVIYARYSSGFFIARLVKTCAENFATLEDASDVEEFYKEHPVPSAQRSVQQGLESIRVNAALLERNKVMLETYLATHSA